MFINIIIAFFLIFLGHKTRRLEIVSKETMKEIKLINHDININQIELTLHNDNEYLKKLYLIYKNDFNKKEPPTIIKLSEFSNFKNKEVYKVNFE